MSLLYIKIDLGLIFYTVSFNKTIKGVFMSLEFFAQYQLEIITILILFLLLILYFLLKKRPQKKETILEIKPAVVDEYEVESDDTKKFQKDVYDTPLEKKVTQEEKTLKSDEEPIEIEKEVKKENVEIQNTSKEQDILTSSGVQELQTQQAFSSHFKKQMVPPHQKIKKEDFSKFSGKRILLAEDNIINQKVILGLLSGSGIDVVIANDGQEALNILENDINFMLVLMDAHMPNIDGFEATRIIRKNPKYDHIVVVALSGDTASDDIKKMKDAGMSETLEKPLKMDALYDILYAYNTQNSIENESTTQKTALPTLETKKGLEICGNDKEFYKDILKEFIQDYGNSDESLNILIKEQKFNEADRLLLDIVGVCANIGAQKMHNIAITAKEMLKTKNKNLTAILSSYKDGLTQTLQSINQYIKEN